VPKRALIVIDVQNEYFDGALPITDPPSATSLANIGRAMDAATAANVPVIVVQHSDSEPDAPIFREGSHAWELHRDIADRPRDHLVTKGLPGSFTGTQLGDILTAAGVDTISITGYMTHMCVDTTAREAAHRGLGVEILNDATGTLNLSNSGGAATGEELHRATLVAQGQFFADVLPTEAWISSIEVTQ
jgi:nicotinamidase-related amidase